MGKLAAAVRRARRSAIVVIVLGAAAALAGAATPSVQSTPTDLTGSADRMISYRHQEHLWQTADGAHHLVLNRGALAAVPGLSLYSSYDDGSTWVLQQTFAGTDDLSTADGQLAGDELSVAYRTAAATIAFARLQYDANARTWSVTASETVFASSRLEALNPALAIDSRGTVWCAMATHDLVTNGWNLRLISRAGGGNVWVDTGLVFGPTDRSSQRSARPVTLPGGMGMVFTVRGATYWAMRSNALPDNSAWDVSTVYAGTSSMRTDVYASHFSVVVDDAGHVHLVSVEDYEALYFRRDAASGAWAPASRLSDGSGNTGFVQVALTNNNVTAGWSAGRGRGAVVVSRDGGTSFAPAASLVLPPAAPGVKYMAGRVEMPTRTTGAIVPLLQQYEDNGVQRLMVFKVPTP